MSGPDGWQTAAVYTEPTDLDRDALAAALRRHWGIATSNLRYVPVGFGTHHFAVDEEGWWVNVDDLGSEQYADRPRDVAWAALERALLTATTLREGGLGFVHAPARDAEGSVIRRLDGRYTVSVYAFLHGSTRTYGEHATASERLAVLEILGRLHRATPQLPDGLPGVDDLAVPQREALVGALGDLGSRWDAGPFSEPARELLAGKSQLVRDAFDRYDILADEVFRTADAWVVTHGEPHVANVIRTPDPVLIDWDTVALAPPERDLWMVEPRTSEEREAYGGPAPSPTAIELYRLRWTLTDVTLCTGRFRNTHTDEEDSRTAWRGYGEALRRLT